MLVASRRRAIYNEISSWAGGGQEEASPGGRARGARRGSAGKPRGRSAGSGLGTGLCGPGRPEDAANGKGEAPSGCPAQRLRATP